MAIENKRMQQRYGTYAQYVDDIANLLPNEFASVTGNDPATNSGKALYFYYGSGTPNRILTDEDKTSMDSDISTATATATQASNAVGSLQVGLNDLQSTVTSQRNRIYNLESVIDAKVEMDDVFEALDNALSGNPGMNMTLNLDNNVDMGANPNGHLMLYYIDSDWTRHNIFDFTREFYTISDAQDLIDSLREFYAPRAETAPTKTVGFDADGIPEVILSATTFSAGACTNTSIKKLYVPSTVTRIDSGAFYNCTALTDVYIDNTAAGITVNSSAFPNGVVLHYHTSTGRMTFNAVDELIKAVHSFEEDLANAAY